MSFIKSQNPLSPQLQGSLNSRDAFNQDSSLIQIIKKQQKQSVRLSSLDVHRGLTMFGMLIADCKGVNKPQWLSHMPWDGFTLVDTIVPAFMFIMGMAIPLSVTQSKPINIKKIARIFGLFLIGMLLSFIDNEFSFDQIRVAGTLQRLSLCYGAVIIIHWLTGYGNINKRMFGSLTVFGLFFIYLSYMISFQNLQIAGCSKQNNLTRKCNFAGYFDTMIFGKHLASGADPQGYFATISAVLSTYFGYYFCLIMKDNKNQITKTLKFWLAICLLLGISVYPVTKLMPLNKRLHSASYALLNVCISGFGILVLVILIDILPKQYQKLSKTISIISQPFIWLGRNPLLIYVLCEIMLMFFQDYIQINGLSLSETIEKYLFQSLFGDNQLSSVINGCFYTILYIILAGILFKKKIFLTL